MICARCGRQFEPHEGRGGQSRFCDECKADRRLEQASTRNQRRVAVEMVELVDLFGARLAQLRTEVTKQQEGRCLDCGEQRKLYLAESKEKFVGLCLNDWEARRLSDG